MKGVIHRRLDGFIIGTSECLIGVDGGYVDYTVGACVGTRDKLWNTDTLCDRGRICCTILRNADLSVKEPRAGPVDGRARIETHVL